MNHTTTTFGRALLTMAVLALAFGGAALPVAAKAEKVDLCHFDEDTGTYHLINVSKNALSAHVDHGDVAPGEAGLGEHCEDVVRSGLPSAQCYTAGIFSLLLPDADGPVTAEFFQPNVTDCSGEPMGSATYVVAGGLAEADALCPGIAVATGFGSSIYMCEGTDVYY